MTMATDVDNDDDEGDDASSTMCDEGDNHNRDNGEDACASTATRLRIGDCDDTASREAAARREAEAV
jgi:hypothetical protein